MERVILAEVAPNDRILSGMKHLLVKYSLCHLIWKAEKVSEVVIVTPRHFRTCLHFSQTPRQKRVDGDSAKASCNALSLCRGNRESSSVLFGDYLDDGSNQCNGAALCTASGESGFVWRALMILCLTLLRALKRQQVNTTLLIPSPALLSTNLSSCF